MGLRLGAAKCIVTSARREDLSCRSNKRLGWEAEAAERSDKWLLKEEVAEGRGASVNRPLSEEVAEK